MRTLSWKPHLGSVTLDVELEDRVLTSFTVSPIHAAIILHFQDKSRNAPTWLPVPSCACACVCVFCDEPSGRCRLQVPGLWRS